MKLVVVASISVNVGLLVLCLWLRGARSAEVRRVVEISARGDESHVRLHERSIAALERGEREEAGQTLAVLRAVVTAGHRNAELRRSVGLVR